MFKANHASIVLVAIALVLAAACRTDTPVAAEPAARRAELRCSADMLEPDLDAQPMLGPGVDANSGTVPFDDGTTYVVSSTYGVPKPSADGAPVTERYLQLFSAIQEQLARESGFVGLQLASSAACASGRTLAIWRSEEEMYNFVTSAAHAAAMQAAREVLQPGYAVSHWIAHDSAQLSWHEAVLQLAARGPVH
jgi:heme-degrading monooxygenase HmoA